MLTTPKFDSRKTRAPTPSRKNMGGLMVSSFLRDDSFDFNTPLLSSAAPSPTHDACDPFTPRSGHSTPQYASIDLGGLFSSTASFSFDAFDAAMPICKFAYQHKNDRIDMPRDYSRPLTPTRRMAPSCPPLDLNYNTMLPVNLNQHGAPSISPIHDNMVDHYTMPQVLQSSPVCMSTPGRSMPASTLGCNHSMWLCNNDSPIMMFSTNYTPSPSPLNSMVHRHHSQSPSLTYSECSSDSRRRSIYEAQRRSLALQRQQQKEMMYRMQPQPGMGKMDLMSTDEEDVGGMQLRRQGRARNRCNVQGCTKTYQKREHLKRHQRAAHSIGGTPETYACPAEGCGKSFKDRFDNFKQHLNIHKLGKSTRTPYNEAAAKLHGQLCKRSKTRNMRRNSPAGD